MKNSLFFIGLLFAFSFAACTPQEEADIHAKRRAAQADQVQRYMAKGQELRELARQRSKPVVETALITPEELKELLPKTLDTRLSATLLAEFDALTKSAQKESSAQAAERTFALLTEFRDQAASAARSAVSAQDFSAKINDLNQQYAPRLAALTNDEQNQHWGTPTEVVRKQSYRHLQETYRQLQKTIAQDYGLPCAQKAQPLLQQTADGYRLILSSASQEDLRQEVEQAGKKADENFAALTASYGDPLFTLEDEHASALRAKLIESHQKVEKQFEKLYGKEAVLQTRDIFEKYKNAVDAQLRQPVRLAQLQESLEAADTNYRKEMTALQVRLNGAMERKAASLRGINLSSNKVYGKK